MSEALDTAAAPAARVMPPPLTKATLVLAAMCFVLGALIALIGLSTPPWMDEFNTYVTTEHGHSLHTFFDYVLRGQHPLGFEGPIYLAQALGVTDLIALRLYNLWGVALALGAVWISYKRGALTAVQAAVIVALYASSTNFMSYFGSLRPYFLVFSSSIAVALAWRLVLLHGWRTALLLWCGALAIFTNLHYFATIFGGLLTAGLLVERLVARDRNGAIAIAAVSTLAASPALVLGILQSNSTIDSGTLYYFTPGVLAGLAAIGAAAGAAIAMNAPAALCALWGGYLALRRRAEIDALALLGLAVLFFALMLGAHLFKPLLYDRYLIAASGAILVAVAILGAGGAAHRLAAPAICVFALLVQAWTLFFAPKLVGWEQTAEVVAQFVQDCPGTQVYTVPYARVSNGPIWSTPLNPTEIEARRFGYRYYAARHHFPIHDLAPGASIGASGGCKAVIWIEHFWPDTPPERLLSNLRIYNKGPAFFTQIGSGVVVTVEPKR
ncbi:MAG TPA: hypothetical protein VG735_16055 [Caulobacterales bacterium]|nr:hypothetical protein [Caulobacterales bacterium]